ncbi:MAG: restriction endonuclease [Pseudomonadota bacterium]|nr:restriction endonuclease [Pseudomonadota bacterium]MDE3037469.1 restriction endonuclease [Pseudomonadota bacterium]
MTGKLYYGDNIDILRKKIRDETIDLCYIDPPFNSKRNYNQIYNNIGEEDKAQSHAFTDTWLWDSRAIAGYDEIIANDNGRFTAQLVDLIKGLRPVLGAGSLLAYLISIALRVTEIQRVLKPAGSFYLHCDPTASHYLKLVLDAVFCPHGGDFKNEIVWHYRRWTGRAKKFQELHDIVFFYTKSADYKFNALYTPYTEGSKARKEQGVLHRFKDGEEPHLVSDKSVDEKGVRENDVWQIPFIAPSAKERLGYPTQKPEALLERIIAACSNEGDVVMDAYCGCGTTVAVAQRLKRNWIGIDITYQSISVILKRLEDTFGKNILNKIITDGIPKDMKSAEALAHKKDDRLRKEFEKWAVLTYTNNRAIINEKKGGDKGIDGITYFKTGKEDNAKIIFQVKSGGVKRGDIATLRGDMAREKAALACLITLEEPTRNMIQEAKDAGQFRHKDMGRSYDVISIVTVKEIVEDGKRLDIPMSLEVLKAAQKVEDSKQMSLLGE